MAINKTKAETFRVDFYDQNKKKKNKTFPTMAQARKYEIEVRQLVSTGEYVPPSKETVKEWAERWLERKKAEAYRRSTLIAWENHVNAFIAKEFPARRIAEVDCFMIEAALAEWAKRVSAKTANKVLTTLRAVFALAKRYKAIRDNVAKEAQALKVKTEEDDGLHQVKLNEVYTGEEVKKLIEATEPGSLGRVLIMLLVFCGLRIGEALGLRWSALELRANPALLHVRTSLTDGPKGARMLLTAPKTKSSMRTLELASAVAHQLKLWKLHCPPSEHDLVFCSIDEGKALDRHRASEILDRAITAAGLELRLTPHWLRHTFASLLFAQGKDAAEVSRLMGHSSVAITLSVYVHFIRKKSSGMADLATAILGE